MSFLPRLLGGNATFTNVFRKDVFRKDLIQKGVFLPLNFQFESEKEETIRIVFRSCSHILNGADVELFERVLAVWTLTEKVSFRPLA